MKDPYGVLGVARSASTDEIKRAYRRLARTMHPDVNPGDPKAEERFKDLNAAYDLLSDADKRARFDRGEIDANGQERPFGFRGGHAGAGPGGFGGFSGFRAGGGRTDGSAGSAGSAGSDGGFHFRFEDLFKGADTVEDIFARAQSAKRKGSGAGGGAGSGPGGGGSQTGAARGGDAQYRLRVAFEEAALGTTRRITLTSGKTLDVRVPPGTESGAVLRLRGQGQAGRFGGPAGDALVEIVVREHPVFRREGDDVIADVPVGLREAVLGAKITVPTIDGRVAVTVPEGSNTGATLRLRGKGLPRKDGPAGARGDQLVRLRLVLEDPKDEKLRAFARKWQPAGAADVRTGLEDPATDG
ncbi:DnaJ C-terminal domain-containing protein [Roseospira goensis]|uniref:DnaJ-class molecular chaperone n=1 Tax=Roseospira goensis TaxID=391922 RepID=A0A7W6WJC8_9PROT|nr:J domain-containing protein [Roseospira goensis]MBB4284443.1 DnaJ-class molecular chaperone [Roseospira goensis]